MLRARREGATVQGVEAKSRRIWEWSGAPRDLYVFSGAALEDSVSLNDTIFVFEIWGISMSPTARRPGSGLGTATARPRSPINLGSAIPLTNGLERAPLAPGALIIPAQFNHTSLAGRHALLPSQVADTLTPTAGVYGRTRSLSVGAATIRSSKKQEKTALLFILIIRPACASAVSPAVRAHF